MITNEGENLIFILSLPRSGSTLLSAILDNSRSVHCPPEPWLLLKLSEMRGSYSFRSVYDGYFAAIATKSFLTDEAFTESARAFAVTAYNYALKTAGKNIFADKTPRYYHILPLIDALFPKAAKIWLKRNPLDVLASYKKTWGIGTDVLSGKILEPSSFDFTIGLHNLIEYFDHKSAYHYEIKYEDIVYNTQDETEKLCRFCNIPFEEEMLNYGKNKELISSMRKSIFGDKKILEHGGVHQKSVDRWKQALSADEINSMLGVMGTYPFSRMGYDEALVELKKDIYMQSVPSLAEIRIYGDKLLETYKTSCLFNWERKELRKILEMNPDLFRESSGSYSEEIVKAALVSLLRKLRLHNFYLHHEQRFSRLYHFFRKFIVSGHERKKSAP
ncbi:MAG: sulfotransferase [Nitrospirae bacterium]|nr:sulfotransferase [Nitrospirota bacterium]